VVGLGEVARGRDLGLDVALLATAGEQLRPAGVSGVRLRSNRLLDVRGRADREWSRIHPVTCVFSLDERIRLVQICKLCVDGDESVRVTAAGAPEFGADVSAALIVGAGNAGLLSRQLDARGGAGKSCGAIQWPAPVVAQIRAMSVITASSVAARSRDW
jgi:hypothetical protein